MTRANCTLLAPIHVCSCLVKSTAAATASFPNNSLKHANLCTSRESWHLRDHVPLLRRLRWGSMGFANLRFQNGPADRLPWRCGKHFNDAVFQRFTSRHYNDCNWVGNVIRPQALEPRTEAKVNELTRDEWYDGVEMFSVRPRLRQHVRQILRSNLLLRPKRRHMH